MLKSKLHLKNRGFTIIELLIVIVVIAILASIVIVAYRGIQDKAYDSKRATALSTYIKLFTLYKNEHGVYPEPSSFYACLGENHHYPKGLEWNKDGQCNGTHVGGGRIYGTVGVDNSINDKLREYVHVLPDPSYRLYEFGSSRYRGPQYFLSGETAQIIYIDVDKGNKKTCSWGGVVYGSEDGGYRQCTIILE